MQVLRYLTTAVLLFPLVSAAGAAEGEKTPPPCKAGFERQGTKCVKTCGPDELMDPKGTGKCVKQVVCTPDQVAVLNKCFPKCPDGMTIDNQGKCRGCPTGEIQDPKGTGKCVKQVVCGPDHVAVLNKCFAKCPDGSAPNTKGGCPKPGAGAR